jgi:hypothetical protein
VSPVAGSYEHSNGGSGCITDGSFLNEEIGVLGFDSRRGLGISLLTTASRTALGPTQPPIKWVPGVLSLGVQWQRREADHSPESSDEIMNAWSYTSAPQYVFMAWCLVKHRDTFTFINVYVTVIRSTLLCLSKNTKLAEEFKSYYRTELIATLKTFQSARRVSRFSLCSHCYCDIITKIICPKLFFR